MSKNAPTWPMDKWPYPTPGQGPLPNKDLPPMKTAKKGKKVSPRDKKAPGPNIA